MNKIILEITVDGFKTDVFINGKKYASSYDANEKIGKGVDFENTPEIPDEIWNALNSMFAYDCVEALQSIDMDNLRNLIRKFKNGKYRKDNKNSNR